MSTKTGLKKPTYKRPTAAKWEDCLWEPDKEEVYTIAELAKKRKFPFEIVKVKLSPQVGNAGRLPIGTKLTILSQELSFGGRDLFVSPQSPTSTINDTRSWRFA